MTNRDNFRIWFADYIQSLAKERNAGFIIVMITFPLLERYLRQRTNAEPKSRDFIAGLIKLFPELQTVAAARTFWTTYRHGVLHNVTMSLGSHGLTHDSQIVEFDSNGKVWLNPVLFADRVLATIEQDFSTFESGSPLPTVSIYGCMPKQPYSHQYYLTTCTPPGSGSKP